MPIDQGEKRAAIYASRLSMGSRLEIRLYHADPMCGRQILEAAFAEATRIEKLLSFFDPASELSHLNRQAADQPVSVSAELLSLIDSCQLLSRLTDGAFDLTTAPLMKTLGFRSRTPDQTWPSPEQIACARRLTGYEKIVVDTRQSTVEYRVSGLQIDFGAVGKGYAVDRIVAHLKQCGVRAAMVDFGSTVYGLGSPPGHAAWQIAIGHPFEREASLGTVALHNNALSTSGDYEHGLWKNGKRYSHIIDPRSGSPASGVVSASVMAPTAFDADALSTAVSVLGQEAGRSLTEQWDEVEAAFVSEEKAGSVSLTSSSGWPSPFSDVAPKSLVSRRRFLAMTTAALAWLLFPVQPSQAITYLTPDEALAQLLPEADAFQHEKITLSPAQKEKTQELLRGRIRKATYSFWSGSSQGVPAGYAVLLSVVGKERPITFMVAVSPEWTVRGIEVLVYRESEGSGIRARRFMKQFIGKSLSAPLKLGRDVHAISGATLSSRSTTYAVKKALALIQSVYEPSLPGTP